ncbi:hypothetical protein [Sphingobacterium spiritivorum]|uniref:hypothetical protein n=1 Tax=Sphingobacterium spiritivorum TaxID=258 RepID=UPI001917D3FD|nr:hypothetical protein [Sphingobacterium spiritivorum]QQT26582.1 hypothetical protein I6J02_01605 [Sphingobacterium spiritivorum]
MFHGKYQIENTIKKIFIIILICSVSRAQGQSNSIPPPDIANSFNGVNIDNEKFYGGNRVRIDLYEIPFSNRNISLGIEYTAGNGIKIDQRPSSVGLGWILKAGGFVSRTVNGRADEIEILKEEYLSTYEKIHLSYEKRKYELKTYDLNGYYSYLRNHQLLGLSDWNSSARISSYKNTYGTNTTEETSSIRVNKNGFNEYDVINTINRNPKPDLAPDIFNFKVADYSGKFFMDKDGKWIVISEDGRSYQLSIEFSENNPINYFTSPVTGTTYYLTIPKIIKTIRITSSDGLTFTFGGDQEVYDIVKTSQAYVPFGYFNFFTGNYKYNRIISNWYLVSVKDRNNGEELKFDYIRNYIFDSTHQAFGMNNQIFFEAKSFKYNEYNDFSAGFSTITPITRYAYRTHSLKKITSNKGIEVDFYTSVSNQLYSNIKIGYGPYFGFNSDPDTTIRDRRDNTPLKLNRLTVKAGSELVKDFRFSYRDTVSERLKLTEVSEFSDNKMNTLYKFEYNSTLLPRYESRTKDHWGYHNNKDFFAIYSTPSQFTNENILKYKSFRSPDSLYLKSEILEKIRYATGGTVEFKYEPNRFTRIFDIKTESLKDSVGIGGGLRLKEIIYKDRNNEIDRTNFIYSPGILEREIPEYVKWVSSGIPGYRVFNAEGIIPSLKTNGVVTYSRVTERKIGNGFIESNYTNYDNGFMDKKPSQFSQELVLSDIFIDNSFKRGKLISKKIYQENQPTPLREEHFKYEHDYSEADKQEYRSIWTQYDNEYAVIQQKMYNNNIREKRIVERFGNLVVESSVRTEYDQFNNITRETTLANDGSIYFKKYKYPYNYPNNPSVDDRDYQMVFRKMVERNMINKPIEIITQQIIEGQRKTIAGSITSYENFTGIIKPEKEYLLNIQNPISDSTFSSVVSFFNSTGGINFWTERLNIDSRMEETVHYQSYDNYGNPLLVKNEGGHITSYLWGYKGLYPILEIENANNDITEVINNVTYTNLNVTLYNSATSNRSATTTINTTRKGDIKIQLFGGTYLVSNQTLYMNYTLTGPISKSGTFCMSNNVNSGCHVSNTHNNQVTFTNMPIGEYTLTVSSPTTVEGSSAQVGLNYPTTIKSILTGKEFFYQSFDEYIGAAVLAETGEKYYSGTFTVPFFKPNSKTYIIDYKYLSGGKWINVSKTYDNYMLLNEGQGIDEVRVYPYGAQMTTYTYKPLVGMTGKTDSKGQTEYYLYDGFQRLQQVLDQFRQLKQSYYYNYRP